MTVIIFVSEDHLFIQEWWEGSLVTSSLTSQTNQSNHSTSPLHLVHNFKGSDRQNLKEL